MILLKPETCPINTHFWKSWDSFIIQVGQCVCAFKTFVKGISMYTQTRLYRQHDTNGDHSYGVHGNKRKTHVNQKSRCQNQKIIRWFYYWNFQFLCTYYINRVHDVIQQCVTTPTTLFLRYTMLGISNRYALRTHMLICMMSDACTHTHTHISHQLKCWNFQSYSMKDKFFVYPKVNGIWWRQISYSY